MFKPPLINGQPLSPVHYSPKHGVHADIGTGAGKIHVPFVGQTTIQTFTSEKGQINDANLARLGGTLTNKDITKF